MTQSVAPDQTDVFVVVRLITDADGTPNLSASAGVTPTIWYRRDAGPMVTDNSSPANLASAGAPHSDWGMFHLRQGYYTVAYPDVAFSAGVGGVLCGMDATGISCVAERVAIDGFAAKFQGKASSVTATTTTFPAGTTPYKGDEIYVVVGTGTRQTRLITSVSGEVATHAAWDVNISAADSTIALLPGDPTLADGGINVDTAVSTRSTVTSAGVNVEVTAALGSFDASKQTSLEALLPTALSSAGNIQADVQEVTGLNVTGTGTSADPWGP